jgi:hypothetical protein
VFKQIIGINIAVVRLVFKTQFKETGMHKAWGARIALFLLLAIMTGCGGGGGGTSGGSTSQGSPSLQVLPSSFDFGTATTNNSPAPLEVTVKNNGTAALRVSGITLSDLSNFALTTNGGRRPCASASPTIAAADYCTFEVSFQPASSAAFSANLRIVSNDATTPQLTLALSGVSEPVATLSVRINQIETSCPASDLVTAYVSVIDQGGYPLPNLVQSSFSVDEGGTNRPLLSSTYVEVAYESIAIAGVMDYSGTMTDQPVAIADMESGFQDLFNGLRTGDLGEVIKFDSEVAVIQAFTSVKAALLTAVTTPFDQGRYTKLYDAAYKAVDDTALQTSPRRAVVITTDGTDEGPSTKSLNDVINNAVAKGVPIFTIGIGSNINTAVLQQMANDTGGQFFQALTSQNLATIYQQLTSVLYQKQYILTFNQSQLGAGVTANLRITATSSLGPTGNDATLITSCR